MISQLQLQILQLILTLFKPKLKIRDVRPPAATQTLAERAM